MQHAQQSFGPDAPTHVSEHLSGLQGRRKESCDCPSEIDASLRAQLRLERGLQVLQGHRSSGHHQQRQVCFHSGDGGGLMVENSPLRWNDPTDSTYGQGPAQEFSATKFIGGSLRALYDDAMQPCPIRSTELLYELAAIEDFGR